MRVKQLFRQFVLDYRLQATSGFLVPRHLQFFPALRSGQAGPKIGTRDNSSSSRYDKILPMKFGCSAILYLFLLSSLVTGCSGANHKSVVFDLSHKEIFSPRQKTGMSYVDLAQKFTDAGFTTKIQDRKITQESLKTANILVLGGPMTPFSDQELKDIAGFVSDGGKLLVMLHISQPASALVEVFGIQATAVIVRQDIDQIDGSNQNFFASRTENHPLTEGVKKIGLFGTWGLRGDPRVGAQMIV